MFAISTSLMLVASMASLASARTMTVKNNCDIKIWPAMFSSVAAPDFPTGWEAEAGTEVSFPLKPHWNGRIWAREGCDFSNPNTVLACNTGGCPGTGVTCTATGKPPATLAEFNIDAAGTDWYDVSLVDGFNLPMDIKTSKDCKAPACTVDINALCPAMLQVKNAQGEVVGCNSDCMIAPVPSNSEACCSGQFSTPDKCPPTGSPNSYPLFKQNCPDAYAYAYDESSHTALWTCAAADDLDYTVTFCP